MAASAPHDLERENAPLPGGPQAAAHGERVLMVDSAPERLAPLRDVLEEAGYTVLLAYSGVAALQLALAEPPDVMVLDVLLPDLDGFELARRLKADAATAGVPLIFMTEPTQAEQVEAAFAAGGVDCLSKPVRPGELLAHIAAHLRGTRTRRQTPNALDAFGQASLVVRETDGRCVWQTALARRLMAEYFSGGHFERGRLPPEVLLWLHREALRRGVGAAPAGLTVLPHPGAAAPPEGARARGAKRLSFTLHAVDPEALGEGQWLIVMREADDAALLDALMKAFTLSAREAEVLYWAVKGRTKGDIGDILGSSPRMVQEQLERVFGKLGVNSRSAAAALALSRVPGLDMGR